MEKTIGNRIKELRVHYNLNVSQFAKGCKLSSPTINSYEMGKIKNPHRNSLSKMANSYNTTLNWLLNGQGEMLQNGTKTLYLEDTSGYSDKEEIDYKEILNKNIFLEKQIERLWQMLDFFTHGNKEREFELKQKTSNLASFL